MWDGQINFHGPHQAEKILAPKHSEGKNQVHVPNGDCMASCKQANHIIGKVWKAILMCIEMKVGRAGTLMRFKPD